MIQFDEARADEVCKQCESMIKQLDTDIALLRKRFELWCNGDYQKGMHANDYLKNVTPLYDRKLRVVQLMAMLAITELPDDQWQRIMKAE